MLVALGSLSSKLSGGRISSANAGDGAQGEVPLMISDPSRGQWYRSLSEVRVVYVLRR